MATLNADFVGAVAGCARQKADASVSVEQGDTQRVFHISRGELVAADSNLRTDRLGDLLVARGRLDAALIEPISAEAKKQGRLLGEQLVLEGLVSPGELAQVLQDQVTLRFDAGLLMMGAVKRGPRQQVAPVIRRPLGACVVAAFRDKVPLEALRPWTGQIPDRVTQFPTDNELADLQLQPWETRILRRLTAGETADQILQGHPSPDKPQRLLAALVALATIR